MSVAVNVSGLDAGDVDWARMAEPQVDGYDTNVVLRLAALRSEALGPGAERRRPPDEARTLFKGAVAIRAVNDGGRLRGDVLPAPPEHHNLDRAEALLARWPTAHAQFAALIDTVYPYTDPAQARLGLYASGSSSHSYEREFGCVHVTVDDAYGLAQALVHEMAHHKLRALGVSIEAASRLIVNPPDQLFKSPIVHHRQRPMTAVFHAQYSFMHVTALDLAMWTGATDDVERTRILMLLARNAPRMEAGRAEISRGLETDADGARFASAFDDWSQRVLSQAQEVLDAHGYGAG